MDGDEMKNKFEDAIKLLEDNDVYYDMVEHPPAVTTEEADKFIKGKVGCGTKTMFMTDQKKRHFYMLIMDDKNRLNTKTLFFKTKDLFKIARAMCYEVNFIDINK